MIPDAFIGMGSNLGDREGTLREACRRLALRGAPVRAGSSLYLTEPVGGPPQGWFVNAVVRAETSLGPEELLRALLEVESELGRRRLERHGPRTLDLDLLLYGDDVRDTPFLRLPHPRLPERRFVLVPLEELDPRRRHPVSGLTVRELRERCPDTAAVVRHAPPVCP
ncbi:MAG TPA: 2-amino-4-hydroxy-6-hydroxymethyldihydropteridine diphosphokinase [Vicinamibacteria bacterium]